MISVISFGSWAIGGTWGKVNDQESMATLDGGVNFLDTRMFTAMAGANGRANRLDYRSGLFIG